MLNKYRRLSCSLNRENSTLSAFSALQIDASFEDIECFARCNFKLSSIGLSQSTVNDSVVQILDNRFKSGRGQIEMDNSYLCAAFFRSSLNLFLEKLGLACYIFVKVKEFLWVVVTAEFNNLNGVCQISNLWSSPCLNHFLFKQFLFTFYLIIFLNLNPLKT